MGQHSWPSCHAAHSRLHAAHAFQISRRGGGGGAAVCVGDEVSCVSGLTDPIGRWWHWTRLKAPVFTCNLPPKSWCKAASSCCFWATQTTSTCRKTPSRRGTSMRCQFTIAMSRMSAFYLSFERFINTGEASKTREPAIAARQNSGSTLPYPITVPALQPYTPTPQPLSSTNNLALPDHRTSLAIRLTTYHHIIIDESRCFAP